MLFIMALYLYVHYTLHWADQFVYSGMLILNNWVKLFEVTYDSITVYSTYYSVGFCKCLSETVNMQSVWADDVK